MSQEFRSRFHLAVNENDPAQGRVVSLPENALPSVMTVMAAMMMVLCLSRDHGSGEDNDSDNGKQNITQLHTSLPFSNQRPAGINGLDRSLPPDC